MLFLRIKLKSQWKKISHLTTLSLISTVLGVSSANAYDIYEPTDSLPQISRSPATYTPSDDIIVVPQGADVWTQNIVVEDDAGIMNSMGQQLEAWRAIEQYAQDWDLQDTGLYITPSAEQQKRFVNKGLLRYLDKRLSGEIKQAERGSTLHSVGKAHKALKPKIEAGITQNIKLKFRARVLQGRGYIVVQNPYVDANAMVSASGRVELNVEKSFHEVGVHSKVQYNVDQGFWVAQIDKRLTDQISARVTSEQAVDSKMLPHLGTQSNQTVQVMYHLPF